MKNKLTLLIIIAALLFSACGQSNQPVIEAQVSQQETESVPSESPEPEAAPVIELPEEPEPEKLTIVCTIFPQYDWVRQILGEKISDFDLVLLGNRVDLHNYQPSVDDIVTISISDLFIYIGGESDRWVDGVLANSLNPDMISIDLMYLLDSDEFEEFIEASGARNEQDSCDDHHHGHHHDHHGHHHHDDDDHHHDDEADEHVWLSLYNAAFLTGSITEAIISLDPANREIYEANKNAYLNKISVLKDQYNEVINNSSNLVILCGDRFPFRYLAEDYCITYYAAFPGCSAETEASFETIIFLAGKIDELKLNSLVVTESSDQSIARTIISNTADKNQTIHVLNSMQSISAIEAVQTTYLQIMESNLKVLEAVLR
ncbi:MAG: metal ABC transporter substrate-binding protein [Lachnospiraceae bacterium]|nr:metal ABC transporter substrate-binding protein [Lachnospiraceae bacterium]